MRRMRAISSAGEHLVYTEGVGGSNPSSPTIKEKTWKLFPTKSGAAGQCLGNDSFPAPDVWAFADVGGL